MRLSVLGLLMLTVLAMPAVARTEDPPIDDYASVLAQEKAASGPADYPALLAKYEALAAQGNRPAMLRLATLANALGDQDGMFRWLRRLAELGDAEGQYYLASTLRRLPDCGEGREWMRKSAEQGFETAVSGLAFYYEEGICGPKDNVQAAVWYDKAARMGIGVAQNNLGDLYRRGVGVRKDMVEAYAWFTLASRQPYAHDRAADWTPYDSGDFADSVRRKLSDSDLQKAEARMARLCRQDKVCSRIPENRRPSSPLPPSLSN